MPFSEVTTQRWIETEILLQTWKNIWSTILLYQLFLYTIIQWTVNTPNNLCMWSEGDISFVLWEALNSNSQNFDQIDL